MKRNILFAFVLLLLSLQIAFAQNPMNLETEQEGYLLGPGDKIQVRVLGEDQFNFEVEIDRNGQFRVPFAENDPINAKCKTEEEIRSEVTTRYSKYLKNPTISLNISQRRPAIPVAVYGEVTSPGTVELRREARLMELLAVSNGVTEGAGGTVRVFRPQVPLCAESNAKVNWKLKSNNGMNIPSEVYSLNGIKEGESDSNPVIYPGDVIVVEKAAPVYINGEVVQPTGLHIQENGLTLSQALGMVGGPRDTADLKEVKIYRLKPNSQDREIIAVNFKEIQEGKKDMMLKPYDIIDVDKKRKSVGAVIFETITGAARSGLGALVAGGTTRILY